VKPFQVLKKKYGLNFEFAKMYKSYYLYSLPMKLKDEGTIIDQKAGKTTFKSKEYTALKAICFREVRIDVYRFYFEPKMYEMEVY
jgi:hypothetical protein